MYDDDTTDEFGGSAAMSDELSDDGDSLDDEMLANGFHIDDELEDDPDKDR